LVGFLGAGVGEEECCSVAIVSLGCRDMGGEGEVQIYHNVRIHISFYPSIPILNHLLPHITIPHLAHQPSPFLAPERLLPLVWIQLDDCIQDREV
jgi:hypothetical protein